MTLACASLGLVLATGEAIRWSASMDTQTRSRDEPAGEGRARYGELDLRGNFELSTSGPDGSAALTWLPSFLLSQGLSGPALDSNASLEGARLELKTRLAPATRLTSSTSFDWGTTDFSPLSGQLTRPVVGQLPSQRFVRTLGLQTMFDLTHTFSRRLELSVAAGIQRTGGLGHEAVSVLPFLVGTQATVSLAWAADRVNTVTVRWSGAESRFSIDRLSVFSDLSSSWTHRASPRTVLDATAGLVFIHSSSADPTSPTEPASHAFYGEGSAGAAWNVLIARQSALRTSLHLRLLPGVDRFTGLAIQTILADGAAEWTEGRWGFGLTGSEARVISGASDGADELRLQARASWTVRGWSMIGGAGAAWTNQVGFAGWQFQALLGLRWTASGTL